MFAEEVSKREGDLEETADNSFYLQNNSNSTRHQEYLSNETPHCISDLYN